MNNHLYQDVVITPFYSPNAHYFFPSLIGNVFINEGFTDHYKFSLVYSKRCSYIRPEIIVEEPAFFAGFLFSAYGHFILESLSRFWFLQHCPPGCKIYFAYNSLGKQTIAQYQQDVFAALGITNQICFIDRVTLFRKCYIPPAGMGLESFFLPQQAERLAYRQCNIKKGKKTYISRSKFTKNRGCKNEKILETILKKRNWNVIYPEELSFNQQIQELSSSETIFCISGSALHSIVFLKQPKQKFIIIPRVHGQTYNMIAALKSDNYYLLNIRKHIIKKGFREAEDLFDLDMEQLIQTLILSSDFSEISKIDNLVSQPAKPLGNWQNLPEDYIKHDIVPDKADSIFYLAVYHAQSRPHLSVQAIRFLITHFLVRGYMIRRLYQIAESINSQLSIELGQYCEKFLPDFGAKELTFRPSKSPHIYQVKQ